MSDGPRVGWRRLLWPLLALVVVGVLVVENSDEVGDALRNVSVGAVLALAGLHVLALVLRAEAWRMCVRRAGGDVPHRALHWSSALRFTADTVLPTYLGLFVRVGMLRRLLGSRAPSVGQMVAADGVMLVIEAVIVLVLLVAVTPAAGLSWWISAGSVVALVAIIALAVHLRERWPQRSFTQTFHVLELSRSTGRLGAVLLVVIGVQPVRFAVALHAVGVDAKALTALFAFVATNVFGALPFGPGPASIGGLATAVHGVGTGSLVAAGVLLAGTAVIAAGGYAAVTTAEALLRRVAR